MVRVVVFSVVSVFTVSDFSVPFTASAAFPYSQEIFKSSKGSVINAIADFFIN